jgi:alpha-galactosidase
MMDPHTGAQLSTDEIVAMCDDLIEAHTDAGYPIF